MKKLFLVASLLMAAGAFASEDQYLYWMVSDDATYTEDGATSDLWGNTYSARVVAFQGSEWSSSGGTYLNLYATLGGSASERVTSYTIGTAAPYFASLGSTGGVDWSYFVELYNDSGIYAHSEALPYSQASIAGMSSMSTPATIWMPSMFVAAPEPTSGMMLLLGCAALALRRRRQKKA